MFICLFVPIRRLEVLEDLPDVDVVFVSVGGGGLISGVAAYLKTKNPNIKVSNV